MRTCFTWGFLNLPFLLSYGIAFDLLILTLPALAGRYVIQLMFTLAIVSVTGSLSDHLNRQLGPKMDWGGERSRVLGGSLEGLISSLLLAAGLPRHSGDVPGGTGDLYLR